MEYLGLGDKIDYSTYNGLVYLLRKFKRLTSDLRLGGNRIESDYGVYNVTGGLTSVGGNFILEDDVTISSSDVLLNCFYTFYFTVVDVNLSGTVNRRVISVTGDTGDNGELEVVLEPSLLESDEVILPEFKVDIVFDEHEYYTPVSVLDITLTVDKSYVSVGEVATVTATVLDDTGSPVEDLELQFNFNGDIVTDITDSDGIASAEYTGTGKNIWVNVSVSGENVKFYDGEFLTAEFTGNSITFGGTSIPWLESVGDVIIDWGDGTQSTVNNPIYRLSHTYTDGESKHSIVFYGTVTSLGNACFYRCTGLTSVAVPDSVTSLGQACFANCTGLTSIVIPDSVKSLGDFCFLECTGLTSVVISSSVISLGVYCFRDCDALVDYELYWTGNDIITYDRRKMFNNTNTIFTIPQGETANYTAKGYPTAKLIERGESLTLTCDKPIIQTTETSTITATLKDTGTPLTSKTLSYQIKHGSTVIDSGSDTTDSNGEISISYTGTGVGDVTIEVDYSTLLQETYELKDVTFMDIATTGKKNSTDWIAPNSNYYTESTTDTGTVQTSTVSSNIWWKANKPGTSSSSEYDWSDPLKIEFDNLGTTHCTLQLYDGTNVFSVYLHSYQNKHITIEITSSTYTVKADGTVVDSGVNPFTSLFAIRYAIAPSKTMEYKNFIIYPI